jgi:hypothetical protein
MRYILGFIIGLGLIVLLFVAIFHHGSNNGAPAPNTTHQMVDYADTSTEVQFTDDFPVTANQNHRAIITTVGRDQVTFSVVSGYENQVIRTQSYVNNSAAYAEFLRSLQLAGYNLKNNDTKLRDERGYCPQGHRYIYEIKDGSNTSQHTWSTSCGNIGNFKGRSGTINDLFHRQVPDYGKLTQDIGLYF